MSAILEGCNSVHRLTPTNSIRFVRLGVGDLDDANDKYSNVQIDPGDENGKEEHLHIEMTSGRSTPRGDRARSDTGPQVETGSHNWKYPSCVLAQKIDW